ncbi:unnamed protein product, partial [Medioppia subpectinata]
PSGDTSRHCLATSDTRPALRPVTTTLAPDLANSRAMAAPIPELDPVIRATLPKQSTGAQENARQLVSKLVADNREYDIIVDMCCGTATGGHRHRIFGKN